MIFIRLFARRGGHKTNVLNTEDRTDTEQIEVPFFSID